MAMIKHPSSLKLVGPLAAILAEVAEKPGRHILYEGEKRNERGRERERILEKWRGVRARNKKREGREREREREERERERGERERERERESRL